MSIFGSILSKLGFGSAQAATPASAPAPAAAAPAAVSAPAAAPAAPAAISEVDVVGQLEGLAAKNPEKLNWRVSIVDLLKLLGLDSSLSARKQLATELACPADKIGGDYSQMNIWLHQAVLQKLAANGGNIPKDLLH